jgi:hypothetical protein
MSSTHRSRWRFLLLIPLVSLLAVACSEATAPRLPDPTEPGLPKDTIPDDA